MAGTAAKILISERQQKLLEEFSKSRTIGKCIAQRATIILLGFAGLLNQQIALQVGLNRLQVGIWRQRWRNAWKALCVWECAEPHRLREAILDVLPTPLCSGIFPSRRIPADCCGCGTGRSRLSPVHIHGPCFEVQRIAARSEGPFPASLALASLHQCVPQSW